MEELKNDIMEALKGIRETKEKLRKFLRELREISTEYEVVRIKQILYTDLPQEIKEKIIDEFIKNKIKEEVEERIIRNEY